MKIKAVYENNVFKPLEKPDLPERTEVCLIIKESFSSLLDELGEIEAREDIDKVLRDIRKSVS